MRPGKVFEVKVINALAENLSLVISLDAETKPRVQSSQSALQSISDAVTGHSSIAYENSEHTSSLQMA
jgi:hypothetical protein